MKRMFSTYPFFILLFFVSYSCKAQMETTSIFSISLPKMMNLVIQETPRKGKMPFYGYTYTDKPSNLRIQILAAPIAPKKISDYHSWLMENLAMFETASLGVLDIAGYAGVSGFDPVRYPEIIIKEVGYLKLGKYNYMSIGVSNKDLTIYILITISQEDTFGIILGVRGKSFLERKLKMQTLLNSIKSIELYKI